MTTARIRIRDTRFALFISFALERVLLQREHRAGGIGDDDHRAVSAFGRCGHHDLATQSRHTRGQRGGVVDQHVRQPVRLDVRDICRKLEQASAAQLRLLQRLARAAPEQQLRFSGIETLKHFLEATAATKAAMADTELARLWKKVAAPTSAPGA